MVANSTNLVDVFIDVLGLLCPKMRTDNPSRVFWQKIKNPLTLGPNLLGVVGINTMRNTLVKPRDMDNINQKCNIIYHLSCQNCEADYIGH